MGRGDCLGGFASSDVIVMWFNFLFLYSPFLHWQAYNLLPLPTHCCPVSSFLHNSTICVSRKEGITENCAGPISINPFNNQFQVKSVLLSQAAYRPLCSKIDMPVYMHITYAYMHATRSRIIIPLSSIISRLYSFFWIDLCIWTNLILKFDSIYAHGLGSQLHMAGLSH